MQYCNMFLAGKATNDILHLVGILFSAIARRSQITQLKSVMLTDHMLQMKVNVIVKCVGMLEGLRILFRGWTTLEK